MFLARDSRSNIKTFFTTFIHGFNVIFISANIFEAEHFLVDLLEYNAPWIWNLVPFCNIMFALPKP